MPRTLYCHVCRSVVGEMANGSRLKKLTRFICKNCHEAAAEIPAFLRGLAGKRTP